MRHDWNGNCITFFFFFLSQKESLQRLTLSINVKAPCKHKLKSMTALLILKFDINVFVKGKLRSRQAE